VCDLSNKGTQLGQEVNGHIGVLLLLCVGSEVPLKVLVRSLPYSVHRLAY
jgi:hypothetical protein